MLKVRHPKGKTEIILGQYRMTIDTKEINPDKLAQALEMLTNYYTRSMDIHHDLSIRYGNLLMDYADIKKKFDEEWEKTDKKDLNNEV